jgi:hypothetical protein
MDKYLVRWKFAAKSMLNDQDTDTCWYQQFHQTKASAVKHYELVTKAPAIEGMIVEVLQLRRVKL